MSNVLLYTVLHTLQHTLFLSDHLQAIVIVVTVAFVQVCTVTVGGEVSGEVRVS